jgi:hypothetical protein
MSENSSEKNVRTYFRINGTMLFLVGTHEILYVLLREKSSFHFSAVGMPEPN